MGSVFRRHVWVGVVVGLAVGVFVYLKYPHALAPTFAWDAAALTFLILTWRHIWGLDAQQTQAQIEPEAPSRTTTDLVVLTAAVLSLSTVIVVLFKDTNVGGLRPEWRAVLGVLAVVLSWCVVHTVYTLKYARLYYMQPVGGFDFNGPEAPAYTDFAYIAFGIGMAFQVADTNTQNPLVRKTVLAHALLSFLFATTILAATINLIAGLKPSI
jgi:uncharacterized membrane protein